jgi:hypothetical protein
MHRFVWDLRYPPPPGPRRLPIAAVYGDTPSEPRGPWAPPGEYVVRLTVGGKALEQPLTVKIDPRVKTPLEALAQQFELSQRCVEGLRQAYEAVGRVRKLRAQLKELAGKVKDADLAEALTQLDRKAAALEGTARRRGERPTGGPEGPSLLRLAGETHHLLDVLQGADAAPTTQAVTAVAETGRALRDLRARWDELQDRDVKALNERLRGAGLPPLAP